MPQTSARATLPIGLVSVKPLMTTRRSSRCTSISCPRSCVLRNYYFFERVSKRPAAPSARRVRNPSHCAPKCATTAVTIPATPAARASHTSTAAAKVSQTRFKSVTTPPSTRTLSFGFAPKLSFHVPAAAHTSSYCNKSESTNTRSWVA